MKIRLSIIAVLVLCAAVAWGDGQWYPKRLNGTTYGLGSAAGDTSIIDLARIRQVDITRADTTLSTLGADVLYPFNLHSSADQAALVRDGDGWKYSNDIDQFRADEQTNGSGVTMPGAGYVIVTPGDSLVVLDATTRDTVWVAAPVAGGLLSSATPALTDVKWADGMIYVTGLDTVGLTRIGLRTGTVEKWLGSGHYAWNGSLSAPNTASGWVKLSTTPALNDDRVNSVDVSRNPYPEVDALHYITVGTLKGITQFVYSGAGALTLWDARQTNPVRDVDVLADGEILHLGQGQRATGWTNSAAPFQTLISSGTNILSAVHSSGNAAAVMDGVTSVVENVYYRMTGQIIVSAYGGSDSIQLRVATNSDGSTYIAIKVLAAATGVFDVDYTWKATTTGTVYFIYRQSSGGTSTSKFLDFTFSTSPDSVHWYQAGSSFTADSRATDGTWSAGGSGSEWMPFDSTATFRSIAGVEGGSPASERCPLVWVGADSGLVGLGALASDREGGTREEITRKYVSPLFGQNPIAAFGGSSVIDVSDGLSTDWANTGSVPFTYSGSSPTGAYGTFASVDYLTSSDPRVNQPGPLTMEAWFYPTTLDSSNRFILSNWGSEGYGMSIGTGNNLGAVIDDGTQTFSYGPVLTVNKWYHGVVTWDKATIKVYLNGDLVKSTAKVGVLDTWKDTLTVGSVYNGSYQFIGRIASAQVDSTVWTADRVAAAYARGLKLMATASPDTLTGTRAPLAMRVNPYNNLLYLAYADAIEIRDGLSGALLASRDSTTLDIGAVATVGWDPAAHPDSFSVVAGGATGVYVETTSDLLTDLTDYVWPDRGGPVCGVSVRADSSGAGDTWKIQTALDMAYNVGRSFVDAVGPYVYPDPVTTMRSNGMQLRGVGGRPLITNANTTGSPAFTTGAFDTLHISGVDIMTAPGAAGGNQSALVITSGADYGILDGVRILDSDAEGIDGTNGEWWTYDDTEVLDSDGTGVILGIKGRISGGNYTAATFPVVSYGQEIANSVFSGGNSAWITTGADTSRVISNRWDCPLAIKSGNTKSTIVGNTVTPGTGHTIEDHGTGTSLTGNIEP